MWPWSWILVVFLFIQSCWSSYRICLWNSHLIYKSILKLYNPTIYYNQSQHLYPYIYFNPSIVSLILYLSALNSLYLSLIPSLFSILPSIPPSNGSFYTTSLMNFSISHFSSHSSSSISNHLSSNYHLLLTNYHLQLTNYHLLLTNYHLPLTNPPIYDRILTNYLVNHLTLISFAIQYPYSY